MRPVYAVMEIVRLLDNLCVLSWGWFSLFVDSLVSILAKANVEEAKRQTVQSEYEKCSKQFTVSRICLFYKGIIQNYLAAAFSPPLDYFIPLCVKWELIFAHSPL